MNNPSQFQLEPLIHIKSVQNNHTKHPESVKNPDFSRFFGILHAAEIFGASFRLQKDFERKTNAREAIPKRTNRTGTAPKTLTKVLKAVPVLTRYSIMGNRLGGVQGPLAAISCLCLVSVDKHGHAHRAPITMFRHAPCYSDRVLEFSAHPDRVHARPTGTSIRFFKTRHKSPQDMFDKRRTMCYA